MNIHVLSKNQDTSLTDTSHHLHCGCGSGANKQIFLFIFSLHAHMIFMRLSAFKFSNWLTIPLGVEQTPEPTRTRQVIVALNPTRLSAKVLISRITVYSIINCAILFMSTVFMGPQF